MDAAKLHLLDALGVALAAASLTTRPRIEDAVGVLGRGDEATGIGVAQRMPASAAALLNGSLIHALEFDDTHMASVIHASAVVAPTALAIAEREHCSGAELLAAFVLGWEVLARIGLSGPNVFQARGFQSTAVAGAPVAALIAGRLDGLDAVTMANAMGIAGSQASGIFEFVSDGSTVKMLHGGWPAHAGIMAAALARAGMTGPATVFEGERGLFCAFADAPECASRLATQIDTLGTHWLMSEVAFKPYPCCHYLQSAIEGMAGLLRTGMRAEDIVAIHCELPTEVAWLVCEPWEEKLSPPSGHVAKFSLPYCLAAVVVDGDIDVGTFDRLEPDPRLTPIMARIHFTPIEHSGFPERYPARLRVRVRDEKWHEVEIMDVHGCPARPFSVRHVEQKFRRNARRLLTEEAIQRVIDSVLDLEHATGLVTMTEALRGLSGATPPLGDTTA